MANYSLEKQGDVFVLTMDNGERDNTFDNETLPELIGLLDEVEASEGDAALVLTSSHEKTWCNGINLHWMLEQDQATIKAFVFQLEELFIRMALLNMPTISCITGNAYAGGAIIATASDFRYMRQDRGRFCFSELNIKKSFTHAMFELVKLLPNNLTLNELVLTGKAMGGEECLQKNVVHGAFAQEVLFEKSMQLANIMATKDRKTYAALKRGLRSDIVKLDAERKSKA